MKLIVFPCLLLGLLLCAPSQAQTACPPGMEEYGVGVCGYSRSEEPVQQAPQQQAPQWATRWGAIATDSTKGSLGTSTGMLSKSKAEQEALSDCQGKGGLSCKLQIAYDNQCAAMILGSKEFNVSNANTVDKAVQLGMAVCAKARDTNCRVYYSACSLPQRIR